MTLAPERALAIRVICALRMTRIAKKRPWSRFAMSTASARLMAEINAIAITIQKLAT